MRLNKLTYVGFRAHVKLASLIVSYLLGDGAHCVSGSGRVEMHMKYRMNENFNILYIYFTCTDYEKRVHFAAVSSA